MPAIRVMREPCGGLHVEVDLVAGPQRAEHDLEIDVKVSRQLVGTENFQRRVIGPRLGEIEHGRQRRAPRRSHRRPRPTCAVEGRERGPRQYHLEK